MDFSVIVPAYNEEFGIERTLQSIRAQKYTGGVELIVVSDGSTDATSDIACQYADVVLHHKTRKGANAARNYGAIRSTNAALAFLDADSMLSENALEVACDSLERGYVGGTLKVLSPQDRFVARAQTFVLNNWARFFGPMYTQFVFTTIDHHLNGGGWPEHVTLGDEVIYLRRLQKQGRLAFRRDAYIETSARRYEHLGYVRTTLRGVLGFCGVNMPWPPVRK